MRSRTDFFLEFYTHLPYCLLNTSHRGLTSISNSAWPRLNSLVLPLAASQPTTPEPVFPSSVSYTTQVSSRQGSVDVIFFTQHPSHQQILSATPSKTHPKLTSSLPFPPPPDSKPLLSHSERWISFLAVLPRFLYQPCSLFSTQELLCRITHRSDHTAPVRTLQPLQITRP